MKPGQISRTLSCFVRKQNVQPCDFIDDIFLTADMSDLQSLHFDVTMDPSLGFCPSACTVFACVRDLGGYP